MKRIIIILALIVVLTACGEQKTRNSEIAVPLPTELVSTVTVTPTETLNIESASPIATENTETASPTPTPMESTIPESPTYIDEANYEGDELEVIKVINLRVKYIWEENESDYMKLLYKDSMVSNFPSDKIVGISLRDTISITEQKYVYQAVVQVMQKRLDSTAEQISVYVLLKTKEENASWTIQDID
ncbi:hypothetical protein [Paenibacillus sp. L3-i20]|uniref:hypothetical protein n=1 Tax=Paenibacillus sp. L3-i20 TaxID=2905833 RepID=UPI001EE0DE69|nr:hypothetical protein [Paenibacillus sp. L3-i20]GKU79183.1 hypothetical protein L3i20_v235800 [Paenibacillus sp. L3-i20]